MNRDLLKEAIADAKAVKETAIANAKAALEEAFTPYLKEKFSAKLQEMDEEEEVKEMKHSKDEVKEETSEPHGNIGEKTPEGEPLGFLEEEDMDEEMDLDEILAELDGMDEAEEEEEVEVDAEEEGEGEEMEDEDIDLEEMSEDDLKSFIEDVIRDMVGSGELEAGEEFEMEDDMEMDGEMEDEESVEDEVEVDEIMEGEEEIEEGLGDKLNKVIQRMKDNAAAGRPLIDDEMFKFVDKADLLPPGLVSKGMEKSGAGRTSSIGETEERDEMKKEIDELKADLQEVNLLNAKLLYVNKIFGSKNLSESQKVKVLEAFDKAKSTTEAKLVFETINENTSSTTRVNESVRGMASKVIGTTAPTKQPILEVNEQFARWQVLAGIKK